MKTLLRPALVVLLCATATRAQQRTVLVELFTSEGCSSCPPADALLRELNHKRTPGGALIVALSEHVTYWNQLGWRDPFSREDVTERQQSYGRRLGLDDVYTPQAVVQGTRQVLGSDRAALLHAVDATPVGSASLHISSVKPDPTGFTISYTISGLAKPADLIAVLAEDTTTMHVGRGENAGRTLDHVAVTRSFKRLQGVTANAGSVHLDGVKAAPAQHVVLFLQTRDTGPVLAVETAVLPSTPTSGK